MSAIRWTFVIIGLIIGSTIFGWYLGELYGANMPANGSPNNVGSEKIISKQDTKSNETEMKTGGSAEITQVTPNVATKDLGIDQSKENITTSTEKTTLSAEVKESQTNMTLNSHSSPTQTTVEPTPGLSFKYSDRTRP